VPAGDDARRSQSAAFCQLRLGGRAHALTLQRIEETFDITGIALGLVPKQLLDVRAIAPDGTVKDFQVYCRVDTPNEVTYIRNGGILQYVLRKMVKA
jgi:aconitate hydratase